MGLGGALVGRSEELRVTLDAIQSSGGVVIVGPPGVGKTRLARETLAAVALDLGRKTDWVQATEATAPIPFGAFSAFVPEWDPVRSPDRLEVLQRLGRVLTARGAAADGRPLTLGVDDGHLLDESSAALVHQLASSGTVKVVCTLRTGELAPEPLVALWKDGAAERFHLQALAREEAVELIVDVLGGAVDIDTERRLWEATEGNPLFLRELVLHGRATGALRFTRDQWHWEGELAAGPRLAEIVETRLRHLQPDERRAMELLVLAPRLPLQAVELIVPPSVLEELERGGLVMTEDVGGRLIIRSSHPLYAEGLRAGLTPLVQRSQQAELARALISSGAHRPEDDLWLSIWSVEAGVEVPIEVLLHGARQANVMGDPAMAERIARAAGPSGGFGAGMALADALVRQRRSREADEQFVAVAALAPDDRSRAEVAIRRINGLHFRIGSSAEEEAAFATALATIDDADSRNMVLAAHATVLGLLGRFREAAAIAGPLVDDPSTPPTVRLQAIAAACNPWLVQGQITRALEASRLALELAAQHVDEFPDGLRLAGSVHLFALIGAGDLVAAGQVLDLVDDFRFAQADSLVQGYRGMARGRLALMGGHPVTALRWLQDAAVVLDQDDNPSRLWWVLNQLAEARALVGDLAGAQAALDESRAFAVPGIELYSRGVRGEVWLSAARGELSRARALCVELADTSAELGEHAAELMILHEACRLGGVREVGARLIATASRVDGSLASTMAMHVTGLLDDDATAMEQVVDRFAAGGFDLHAAEAGLAAAAAYRQSGLTARASAAEARARELAARCEGAMTPGLAGLPADDGLTRREREIAGLAATGLSSPDIAERLTVSVRTVENHLQRIYAKLGVSNRRDLSEVLRTEVE